MKLQCVKAGRLEVITGIARSAEAIIGDTLSVECEDQSRYYGKLHIGGDFMVLAPGLSGHKVDKTPIDPSTVEFAVTKEYVQEGEKPIVNLTDFWAEWVKVLE